MKYKSKTIREMIRESAESGISFQELTEGSHSRWLRGGTFSMCSVPNCSVCKRKQK